MNILGYHGVLIGEEDERRTGFGGHDAAAVLLQNGELVAAFEEERLNRLKHANCFPVRAIRACLERAGMSLAQVDRIAVDKIQRLYDRDARRRWLSDPEVPSLGDGRGRIAGTFARAFDIDVTAKITFCPHHLAHAWSAFIPSGFDESLILVADGEGDESVSGTVALGRGQDLTILREYHVSQSLGHLYSNLISLIGYGRFDEYKVMGLAPYGDPVVFRSIVDEGCRLLPNGDYELDPTAKWLERLDRIGLVARARRKGEPFSQEHIDFAAALQQTIERVLLHVLGHYRGETGQTRLCLAGGVSHNCSANGKILYSGLFEQMFVQPASHDAGGAYGAALHAAHEEGCVLPKRRWTHVYFGTDAGGDSECLSVLQQWERFITWERVGASPALPARLLAEGAVLGWVQGQAEFGPRALGNRSILADPRPPENKARINAMVKKREAYRPFAPAVLEERVRDYFEVPCGESNFPFMIMVLKVKPQAQALLGAITHVDGTARVQTVGRGDNPRFWSLIECFGRHSGVGMLLNTSFNNHAEPIVDTADDAIACFLTTGLDYLVLGDYLISKRQPEIGVDDYGTLVPRVPHHRRLVRATRPSADGDGCQDTRFLLESTRSSAYGVKDVQISAELYRVLHFADGRCTLAVACVRAGLAIAEQTDVHREAAQLWGNRVLVMRPAPLSQPAITVPSDR